MQNEPLEIKIPDLGLVAALVTLDFEVVAEYRDENGRAYFVFEDTPALAETANEYYADNLTVLARRYFDNTKMLKTRIHSGR